MLKFSILLLILFSYSIIHCQIEKKNQLNELKLPDTSNSIGTKIPMLYLESAISKNILEMNSLDRHSAMMIKIYSEGAAKEDLALGLSDDQLLAYLKNKNTLKKILQQKYDEGWWYRVKGIDELLGIPSEVFFILKLAFLFL